MARRSRAVVETVKAKFRVWRIAIYIRLSKEDARCLDESESLTNQRQIIEDHIAGFHDGDEYIIVDEYVDDGISGTTDDERDDFQRMLSDIKRGRVNCVIVKDLARSFRNYSDQGYYLDDWFPRYNVRFISLYHQPLDSYKEPQNMRSIAVPIQGVLNENHCAETSDKVREVFDMKRRNGEHIGSFAAYGYVKDPNDKNSLIVDEEAAEVVKSIYHWFVNEGYSKMGIAKRLNQMGEPNPEAYKKKKGFKYNNPNSDKNDGLWSASTIARILQNEVYTGVMVQGRHRIISYKVHKQINVPEDEWFVVPNTHEAIIDRETFEKAQALHKRDTRTAPGKREVYLLSGFVRCADCQKAMRRKTARNIAYYSCRSYIDKKICSKHSIRQDKLENAVLAALQMQIALVDRLAEEIERINNAPVINRESKRLSHSLKQAEKQLKQYNDASDSLYLDWKSGEITKEEYRRLKGKIAEQIQQLEANISYLKEEMQVMADGIGTDDPYLTAFLKYKNIQSLNRGIMVELVKAVWVHENGEITVDFNFADEYQRIIDYIENNHNVIRVIENKAI